MGRRERQKDPVLPRSEFLNEQGLVFGARYESAAVLPDDAPAPAITDPVTQYVPSADPGCRAPHLWLTMNGRKMSSIDLFGNGFVLLAGPQGQAWREAAKNLRGPAVAACVLGEDLHDLEGRWPDLYPVGPQGAVLVRPDGVVAWRARGAASDHALALATAIQAILGKAMAPAGHEVQGIR